MNVFLRNLLFLTLPALSIIFLLLELTFRFAIPAANKPDLYFDLNEQMIRFNTEKNLSGVFTAGKFAQQKGQWSVNNFGWNSPHDYTENRNDKYRIAVIGDSFIEALIVDNTSAYPSLLETSSPNAWEVYSFGISGAPFSQYLHMSRYVSEKFNPDVLIFNIVHNDFYESLTDFDANKYFKQLKVSPANSISEVSPTPYKLTRGKELIKRSALIRYIYINLKLRYALPKNIGANKAQNYNANISVDQIVSKRKEIELAVDYICRQIRTENPGKKIIMIMDGPRNDIYSGRLSDSNVLFLNRLIAKYAASNRLDFIDLSNVFEENFKQNKIKFNSEFDSHWNEYGHQVIADTLYKYLKNDLLFSKHKYISNDLANKTQ